MRNALRIGEKTTPPPPGGPRCGPIVPRGSGLSPSCDQLGRSNPNFHTLQSLLNQEGMQLNIAEIRELTGILATHRNRDRHTFWTTVFDIASFPLFIVPGISQVQPSGKSTQKRSEARRKLAQTQYDPASRPARVKQAAQPAPARYPLPAPCPRNGTQYVAPQNQPAAAWELASQPHEARSTTINIFLQTLTAYDLQHDISRCGGVLLSAHQASYGGGSETLSEIAQRCIRTANSTAVFHLHFIVALMTLSFKCASLSNWKESVNLAALHREHLSQDVNSPSVRTLQYWYAGGSKLISLAAGGSFYMLLWLAYTDLRTPFIEADGNIAYDLANILRNPNSESSAGRLVQSTIIPTLAFLSQQCPVKLGEFFSTNLLSELAISAETLCSDLSTSDRLFDALPS
ncbi:uncharacterized protein C8Q71DRAFT_720554, partial [Rhodofomes roseus]